MTDPLTRPNRLALRACVSATAAAMAFPTAAQRQVVKPIDESHRVTLSGNTRPEANEKNDLGAVEESLPLEHLRMLLSHPAKLQR